MSVRFNKPIRITISSILAIIFLLSFSFAAHAAQVTLAWDPNNSAPDGYRIYQRVAGQAYDYTTPAWPRTGDDPTQTTCTLENLADGTSYYFVVRAYEGSDESGDSNEINYVTPPSQTATYAIAANAGANGSISPGSATVPSGENQTFLIIPNTGYSIEDVQVDGTSVGPVSTYTFYQVDANHTISALFSADSYPITSFVSGNGTVTPGGLVSVAYGMDQVFVITPGFDSMIADVLVDGQSIGPVASYTFANVNATHTIHAVFDLQEHFIMASAGSNGGISPTGEVAVGDGGDLTFTVTPQNGYRISDVVVDGLSVGPVESYVFSNVTGDHTIAASFTKDVFTITASASEGGSISPTGIISTSAGNSQTFQVAAAQGYKIEDVTVDGVSVGAVSSYTFTMVDGDHTIDAVFKSANQAPVADAGPDQVVDEQTLVTLNGLNSIDADDGIATFQWHQISGPMVNLSLGYDGMATFYAPDVGATGEALEFELIVTDFSGVQVSDRCIINVTWVNAAPVADAGADQTFHEGHVVVLDASGSTDTDDGIATYQWHQMSGPAVELTNAESAYPSFSAPDVGPEGAALTFQLTVTDSGGLQDTDSCLVTITWNNAEPVADAGPDHQVTAGTEVQLDASDSVDPDGMDLMFHWRQAFGPPVILSDATALRPMFTVPQEGFEGQVLTFELTVTDSGGLQSVDSCSVSIAMPEQRVDDTPPVLSIYSPSKIFQFVLSGYDSLAGAANDDTGVVRVVWQNNRGGSGVATGTTKWRIDKVKLQSGFNRIKVTAVDAAGNQMSKEVILYRIKLRRR